MKQAFAATLCATLTVFIIGCSGASREPDDRLVRANARLAVFLSTALDSDPSIQSARLIAPSGMLRTLAVLQAGSAGRTRDAISDVLGGDVSASEGAWRTFTDVPGDVRQGDALWLAQGYRSSARFAQFASSLGMPIASFSGSEHLKSETSAWLQRIGIPSAPVAIPGRTIVLGLDALGIDARWKSEFDERLSTEGTFHAPGSERKVTFMRESDDLRYARVGKLQLVNLPYTDGLSIWLGVTPGVPTRLPDLLAAISKAGAALFSAPDLTPMLGDRSGALELSTDVALTVDEKGTKVVAITEFDAPAGARYEPDQAVLTFDHPFAFAIVNEATSTLLLAGTILDPKGG